jgi:molecular chaperone HtpG
VILNFVKLGVKPKIFLDFNKIIYKIKSMFGDSVKPFSTEINRLLEIVTHSLYPDKSIFIRELITNSVDACNKSRFFANKGVLTFSGGKIFIKIDAEEKTLTFCDNGVGMTLEQLEKNLSTIAYSGTREMVSKESLDKGQFIGQFGLGFYSSFVVADRVMVWSKHFESKQPNIWESDGKQGYQVRRAVDPFVPEFFTHLQQINEDKSANVEYGTQIKLFMKKDCDEFLNEFFITNYVKRNLNYVNALIYCQKLDEEINTGEVLWKKTNLSEKENNDIYAEVLSGQGSIYASSHVKKEGLNGTYTCLLYIPSKEYFLPAEMPQKPLVKLFANNVFVYDEYDILPPFCRFAKGIVDISDAPINVSRQSIQDSKVSREILNFLPKSLLDLLIKESRKDIQGYKEKFFQFYGPMLKEGLCVGTPYKTQLMDTLIFKSATNNSYIFLEDYIKNLTENDAKEILYTTNPQSPQTKFYMEQGKDVLIMTDKLDNIWPNISDEYINYKFVSIDFTKEVKELTDDQKSIVLKAEEFLNGKVKSVKVCENIRDRVSSFMRDEGSTENYKFARLLNMKTGNDEDDDFAVKPVLGLNIHHSLIQTMLNDNLTDAQLKELIDSCFAVAFLSDEYKDSTIIEHIEKLQQKALN